MEQEVRIEVGEASDTLVEIQLGNQSTDFGVLIVASTLQWERMFFAWPLSCALFLKPCNSSINSSCMISKIDFQIVLVIYLLFFLSDLKVNESSL